MSILKKILQAKISIIILGVVLFVVVLILIVPAIAGVSIGYEEKIRQASEIRGSNTKIIKFMHLDIKIFLMKI